MYRTLIYMVAVIYIYISIQLWLVCSSDTHGGIGWLVFNTTFNSISYISWHKQRWHPINIL